MTVAHAWVGPYDGGWHCYQCGTTVTLPTGQEPDISECPVTTDELVAKFRQQPGGWSRRSWSALVEMLRHERDEARADARRYRWLKAQNPLALATVAWCCPEACRYPDPDRAIDAAMDALEKQHG